MWHSATAERVAAPLRQACMHEGHVLSAECLTDSLAGFSSKCYTSNRSSSTQGGSSDGCWMRSVHECARADACRCGRLHAGSGVAAGSAAPRHCDRRAPTRRLAPRRGAQHGHHVRPAAPGCLQPCHRTGQGMVMRCWPPAADPGVCMHARRPLPQFKPGRHTSRPPPGPAAPPCAPPRMHRA